MLPRYGRWSDFEVGDTVQRVGEMVQPKQRLSVPYLGLTLGYILFFTLPLTDRIWGDFKNVNPYLILYNHTLRILSRSECVNFAPYLSIFYSQVQFVEFKYNINLRELSKL